MRGRPRPRLCRRCRGSVQSCCRPSGPTGPSPFRQYKEMRMAKGKLTRTLLSVEALVIAACERHKLNISCSGPSLDATLHQLNTPGLPAVGANLPVVAAVHYILTNAKGVNQAEADAFVDALRWDAAPQAVAKPSTDEGCMSGCAIRKFSAEGTSTCRAWDEASRQHYTVCRLGAVSELLRAFDRFRAVTFQ